MVLGRQLTERGHHFPLAFQLGNLADISLRRGDLAEARRLTNEEALEVAQAEGDDVNIADAGSTLAHIAALEGDYEEAARLLRGPLRFSVEIGARWPGGALGLAGLVGAHRGHRTKAAKLLGALDGRRARLGFRGWEDSESYRAIFATIQKLDEDGYAWALAEGRELWFEELFRDRATPHRLSAACRCASSRGSRPSSATARPQGMSSRRRWRRSVSREAVVVGVARGGVAVAVEVGRRLGAQLTAVDVERVNARGLRLGAVTADGPPYLREDHGVPEAEVESALEPSAPRVPRCSKRGSTSRRSSSRAGRSCSSTMA